MGVIFLKIPFLLRDFGVVVNEDATNLIPVLVFIGDWIKISPDTGYWDLIPIYWRTEIA
jgi:hypothetical protein